MLFYLQQKLKGRKDITETTWKNFSECKRPLLLKYITQSCVYNTQITKISASSTHTVQAQGLKMEFLLSLKATNKFTTRVEGRPPTMYKQPVQSMTVSSDKFPKVCGKERESGEGESERMQRNLP